MQTVLLDTDYAIDYLRGKSEIKEIIIQLFKENAAFLSVLSIYELHAGMRTGEDEATNDFIQGCRIEPVSVEIARNAGAFRLKQRNRGITLSVVDCIIAETARINHHQIATNNKSHFPETSFFR